MYTESLSCSQCGSTLQIPRSTSYVTCTYCSTDLVVHWDDAVPYTEQLAHLEQRTQHIAAQLAQMQYKTELDRVLQEWEEERKRYMLLDQHGHYLVPQAKSFLSPVVSWVLIGVGILAFVLAVALTPPRSFLLLLLALLFFVGFAGLVSRNPQKAQAYAAAQKRFQDRIEALKQKHEHAKRPLSLEESTRLRFLSLLKAVTVPLPPG